MNTAQIKYLLNVKLPKAPATRNRAIALYVDENSEYPYQVCYIDLDTTDYRYYIDSFTSIDAALFEFDKRLNRAMEFYTKNMDLIREASSKLNFLVRD